VSEKAMMSTKSFFKMTAIAVAVGAAVVGCGGGSGTSANLSGADGTYSVTATDGPTFNGTVVESNVSGATMTATKVGGLYKISADITGATLSVGGAAQDGVLTSIYSGVATKGESVNASDVTALTTLVYEMASGAGELTEANLNKAKSLVDQIALQIAGTTDAFTVMETISQLAIASKTEKTGFARFLKLLAYDMADGTYGDGYVAANAQLTMGDDAVAEAADGKDELVAALAGDKILAARAEVSKVLAKIVALAGSSATEADKALAAKILAALNIADTTALTAITTRMTAAEGQTESDVSSAKAPVTVKSVQLETSSTISLGSASYTAALADVADGAMEIKGSGSVGSDVTLTLPVLVKGSQEISVDVSITDGTRTIKAAGVNGVLTGDATSGLLSGAEASSGAVGVSYTAGGVEKTAEVDNAAANLLTVSSHALSIELGQFIDKIEAETKDFTISSSDKFDVSIKINGVVMELTDGSEAKSVNSFVVKGVTGIVLSESGGDTSGGDTSGGDTLGGTLLTSGTGVSGSDTYTEAAKGGNVVSYAVYALGSAGTPPAQPGSPKSIFVKNGSTDDEMLNVDVDELYNGTEVRVEVTVGEVCKSSTVTLGTDAATYETAVTADGACKS
jgi:hypothetical protein